MRKYYILPLLLAVAVGLSAPLAFAQTTGSVKGICKDFEGKPIAQAQVEWLGTESGHRYSIKTNNKGEYFSLGIAPGKYNVTLNKDGKELWHVNGVSVGLDETALDLDLRKEQVSAAQSQGLTPEQAKARAEQAAKAENEKKTVGTLNDKLNAAKAASDAGDFETAIATLTAANQIDGTRDLIWFKLADAYRMSAPKQTDPAEKLKRYEMAATNYQKAIDLRSASEVAQKDPDNNFKMAAYYNNLAEADSKSNKVDESVANYNKAAQLDPAHAATYLYNEGAVLTNAGKVDDAIVAFDKVIAADPTKADAYYWKGVNLIGKATLKGDKMVAPEGTAEAFQKYLELQPEGKLAQPAKDMLASIGATIETGFGTKKKPVKK
ncbi:MAG TPA: carboxypeptidase regulatory-like domain-containing protein [Terriglobales bacterium]|jgi:tetratricopeptide (TPR) repeat protein|nr:carboxypeptidase regulatory-like domain-containing protein [Terriglobales bacterium]